MVVGQPIFDQDSMSYFEYLRRYQHEVDVSRIHFGDYCKMLKLLAEGEFFLAALRSQEKRGPIYRKLLRAQSKLRHTMLIKETEVEGIFDEEPVVDDGEILA